MMYLYKISQTLNRKYDSYDSAVVAAESEEQARYMHPGCIKPDWYKSEYQCGDWAHPDNVQVTLIGTAFKDITVPTVIVASFNAG